MNKTHIINIDNTNKFIEKQQKKNELLHLYFHDILVVGRASIQQKLLGNRLAICLFLYSKNPNFFTSVCPPAPFFKTKLTRTKQLIDYGLSKQTHYIKFFKENKKNCRAIWTGINKIICPKNKKKLNSPTSLIDEGIIITNSKNIAEHFNKFFNEIGTNIQN